MIADLLPLIVASALLPAWIISSLLLLRGQGGLVRAAGFVAGAILVRSLVIFFFHFVFGAAADKENAESGGIIASALLIVVGVMLLVAAYKKWRKEDDPDAPPPKWMSALGGLAPLKAIGFGALLMLVSVKQWVFTLSAVAIVEEAQVSIVEAVLAFALFVLGSMSLVLAPILLTAIVPQRAAQWLDKAMGILDRNDRVITIGASLIFGVWFLVKGITGLLGG